MTGPLPAALDPLAAVASRLYGWAVARRNRRFDRGRNVVRAAVPVISVGNLTTGGVGKTPMVAHLAAVLVAAGHRPAIAMRGYGSTRDQPGDEHAEYAWRLPDVPVVADPRRAEALAAFLPAHPEIDCVILDDGFQHRGLDRDLDVLLVDATAGTFDDRLLPAGHLREPVSSAARADAVVITHAGEVDPGLADAVARVHGRPPVAWTRHEWTAIRRFDGEGTHEAPVSWLDGRRVLTLLGVGRPDLVRRQIEAAGASIAADVPARDHERYDRAKLEVARGLADGLDGVVVTGKDWVKIRQLVDFRRWSAPILVPELSIGFLAGEDALRTIVLDGVHHRDTEDTERARE